MTKTNPNRTYQKVREHAKAVAASLLRRLPVQCVIEMLDDATNNPETRKADKARIERYFKRLMRAKEKASQ